MTFEFYHDFNLKILDVDDNIETKVFDDGVLVTFVGEENGVFFPYESGTNSMPFPIAGEVEDVAMPLMRYIVEKYNLLICGIGLYSNAAIRCCSFDKDSTAEDFLHAVIEDYATFEMLTNADKYSWSAEYIVHLKTVRKAARERLGVKESYQVGDVVKFDFCDDELIHSQYGKVIYVDKLRTIVHVTAHTRQLMCLNRESIPHDVVSVIIGQPIENVIERDYDQFIDMMDPESYLATNPFSSGTWIDPS